MRHSEIQPEPSNTAPPGTRSPAPGSPTGIPGGAASAKPLATVSMATSLVATSVGATSYAGSVRARGWWGRAWRQPGVRRAAACARTAVLLADIAMDIRVLVWLFAEGWSREAGACVAFIAIPQAIVALTIFINLFLRHFTSCCALLFLGPPLLAVTPLLGPALAAWHLVNPDSPLVTWRYVQLVEVAVALVQAPAQAIIQSVAYASVARAAGAQIGGWQLFVASIALSLADVVLTAAKLVRDRRGPRGRLSDALSDLTSPGSDSAEAYETLDEDMDPEMDDFPDHRPTPGKRWGPLGVPRPMRGESYMDPLLGGDALGSDAEGMAGAAGAYVAMRNPLLALQLAQQQQAPTEQQLAKRSGTFGSPLEGSAAASSREGAAVASGRMSGDGTEGMPMVILGGSTRGGPNLPNMSMDGRGTSPALDMALAARGSTRPSSGIFHNPLARLSRGSATSDAASEMYSARSVASSGWSLRLPPPPQHPTLLTQSSLHLAVSSAMSHMGLVSGVPIPVAPVATRSSRSGPHASTAANGVRSAATTAATSASSSSTDNAQHSSAFGRTVSDYFNATSGHSQVRFSVVRCTCLLCASGFWCLAC